MSIPQFSLLILVLCFISVSNLRFVTPQKTWCVAKPSTEETSLKNIMNYVCVQSGMNCDMVQPGRPCSIPNTLINHASAVMNLFYQANGRQNYTCYFSNSGLVSVWDPSYGSCIYG